MNALPPLPCVSPYDRLFCWMPSWQRARKTLPSVYRFCCVVVRSPAGTRSAPCSPRPGLTHLPLEPTHGCAHTHTRTRIHTYTPTYTHTYSRIYLMCANGRTRNNVTPTTHFVCRSIPLSVCMALSVLQSVCLSVCLSVSLSTSGCIFAALMMSLCRSIFCLADSLCVCLSVSSLSLSLCFYLFLSLPISVCLSVSVCPSVHRLSLSSSGSRRSTRS